MLYGCFSIHIGSPVPLPKVSSCSTSLAEEGSSPHPTSPLPPHPPAIPMATHRQLENDRREKRFWLDSEEFMRMEKYVFCVLLGCEAHRLVCDFVIWHKTNSQFNTSEFNRTYKV